VLPPHIPEQACWYADEDILGAKLWDIEPTVQVAGITRTGAIVLDGCRTAAIRWKGFPRVGCTTKASIRRWLAAKMGTSWFSMIVLGSIITPFFPPVGAIFLVLGLGGFLGSPFLIAYANSGRIIDVVPWMIGVRGVLSTEDAELRVYGTRPFGGRPCKMAYAPTGSLLSSPAEGPKRGGTAISHQQAERAHLEGRKVFTLIDTTSGTVCHFVADRPPTVCIFVGREGGLGRYILCSENCAANELHKEAVVRLPSYISRSMRSSDWLAIGSAPTD